MGQIEDPIDVDSPAIVQPPRPNPDGGPEPLPPQQLCAEAPPAPLARLTNLEYSNSLHALFPDVTMPEAALPSDIVVEGFDNNAKAQTPSPALVEQYQASARAVATAVTSQLDDVLPCDAATSAQQDSCGERFVAELVSHAYRRPITSDEHARYTALFAAAKADFGFSTAIGMVIEAALQSPHFLYRVELGGPAANGVASLDGWELASRLSYFLWDGPPDEALLDAAASGMLAQPVGVEREARRMLEDSRAHAAVANLFQQWLRFDKLDRMPKDPERYPEWNDQVAAALGSSTRKFVDHVFWDLDGSVRSLLTDRQSYVEPQTAKYFGLTAAPSGGGWLETNPEQRSGILTQVGLMAAFAHETHDSPILRGVFVLDRLLCQTPAPPPPGVTGSVIDGATSQGPMTTRQRIAMTHEQGDCAACHHTIDGYGFGFSHYDALGMWRETENGLQVDGSGWIANTDVDGTYDGAVELGQRLAQSNQVRECVAQQWFRYSLGLGAADVPDCALEPVARALQEGDGDLHELIIATVTSPAFRSRPEVTP
ncbi:MAG: DUF1592 domain-containing protein [Polyangiales bacterium]